MVQICNIWLLSLGKARVFLVAYPSTINAIHIQPFILQTNTSCTAIISSEGETWIQRLANININQKPKETYKGCFSSTIFFNLHQIAKTFPNGNCIFYGHVL